MNDDLTISADMIPFYAELHVKLLKKPFLVRVRDMRHFSEDQGFLPFVAVGALQGFDTADDAVLCLMSTSGSELIDNRTQPEEASVR